MRQVITFSRLIGTIFLLGISAACSKNSSAWDIFTESTVNEYYAMKPHVGVDAGLHQYDGIVPDMSKDAIQNEWVWLTAKLAAAQKFDVESLSDEQNFEREYLIGVLDGKLFWLEDAKWPAKSPSYYAGAINPTPYVMRDYAPLAERMVAFTNMANGVPRLTEQVMANLEPPLAASYVKLGRIRFGGLASFFENDIPMAFAEVMDDTLQANFRAAVATAVSALNGLDAFLADLEPTAHDDYALGTDLYKKMLWRVGRLDISLDELEAIGRADLARNQKALAAACAALTPEGTIAECLAIVMNDKPEDGPVEEARRQLAGLKALVLSADLVSIPGKEEALVAVSPPFNRANSAYISIPGPYEEGVPSTYYISPPDPEWPEDVQYAYIPGKKDLMFTSVHEIWPGHFLHFLHSNRSKSIIGKTFSDYAFTEGWAHYSEELMWEAQQDGGDPAIQVGQLLNALLRNVRYLSSIGLHTQGMTIAESEVMFMAEAHQDPGNAMQQAARGTYDPEYLNYTLGKLMIRQLRTDWTASRGGRQAWKAFHDTFLSYGAPPVPLVQKAMLGDNAAAPLRSN